MCNVMQFVDSVCIVVNVSVQFVFVKVKFFEVVLFVKIENFFDGLINVIVYIGLFLYIFQEEVMMGGKCIFVFVFVGDIYCVKLFVCWLDIQFDMCINGSLYLFGWNQDVFC